jgi:hypothetical protein
MSTRTPPTMSSQQSSRQYYLGLGLGAIPLLAWGTILGLYLSQSGTTYGNVNMLIFGLYASLVAYAALLVATIVCLAIRRVRSVGYGLLTAFLATPVVVAIGCTVILNRPI